MPSTLLHRIPSTTTTTTTSTTTSDHHTKRHSHYHLLPQNLTTQLHHHTSSLSTTDHTTILTYHTHHHRLNPNQVSSAIIQTIPASPDTVWSILHQFNNPQSYKPFLNDCSIIFGDGISIGSIRQVSVVSGIPAASSTERLEILDHDRRAFGFAIIGGENRLTNYRSVTTLHELVDNKEGGDSSKTVVVESYVVDVPEGNTREETCVFVDTIVRCNLKSLSDVAGKLLKSQTVCSWNSN